MTRTTISPEEGKELARLLEEHAAALAHAGMILHTKGGDSLEFLEADKATSAIQRRIKEIRGTTGSHWMA